MLRLRDLTEEERKTIERLVHARSTPVGILKRAQIIWLASQGEPSALWSTTCTCCATSKSTRLN